MTRLRIAYVLPTLGRGGAEHCVLQLARGLDSERFEPVVIALRGGAMRAEFEAAGIEVRCCDMRCRFDVARLWRLRRWLTEFDLVHSHLYRAGQAVGLLAPKSLPWCHTVHTFEPRRLRNPRPKLVAVANAVAAYHAERNVREADEYTVIPNGVDVTACTAASETSAQWRAQWGIEPGAFVVSWIGRDHRDKGVDVLRSVMVEMIRRQRPMTWLIAGEGLDAAVGPCSCDAIKTICPGYVDAAGVLAAADVCLLTSRIEGFPLVVCEAMAAGCATIAPAVGGIGEILDHDRTGLLVAPLCEDGKASFIASLVGAIERLMDDAELRNRLGESAKAVAIERLNVETMVSAHERLYDTTATNQ